MPELYGVRPSYATHPNWKLAEGDFLFPQMTSAAAFASWVKLRKFLFGYGTATGKYVKINDTGFVWSASSKNKSALDHR